MRNLEEWLSLYQVSHQNRINKLIHRVCVPVITFTVFGLLWLIPTPAFMDVGPLMNFSTLFGLLFLIFYLRLSLSLGLVMFLQMCVYWFLCHIININSNLLLISSILFIIAWIGQFIGHKIEGEKPSFFEDIQFLLIGPIWVMKDMTGFPK